MNAKDEAIVTYYKRKIEETQRWNNRILRCIVWIVLIGVIVTCGLTGIFLWRSPESVGVKQGMITLLIFLITVSPAALGVVYASINQYSSWVGSCDLYRCLENADEPSANEKRRLRDAKWKQIEEEGQGVLIAVAKLAKTLVTALKS